MQKGILKFLFATLILCAALNQAHAGEIAMKLYFQERDDDENYCFYAASNFTLDRDSNLYIVDSRECHIKKYSPDGSYTKTIGSRGEGPGELNHPRFIDVVGNELFVAQSGRISIFTLDGKYLDSFKTPSVYTRNGAAFISRNKYVTYDIVPKDVTFSLLLWSSGKIKARIKSLDASRNYYTEPGGVKSSLTTDVTKRIEFDVDSSGAVIYAVSDTFEIFKYEEGKSKPLLIGKYTPVKLPEEVKEAKLKSHRRWLKGSSLSNLSDSRLPQEDSYPMIRHIIVDEKDNIWIDTRSNELTGLVKYSKEGKHLGSYAIKMPPEKKPLKAVIKNHNLYYLVYDYEKGIMIYKGDLP